MGGDVGPRGLHGRVGDECPQLGLIGERRHNLIKDAIKEGIRHNEGRIWTTVTVHQREHHDNTEEVLQVVHEIYCYMNNVV